MPGVNDAPEQVEKIVELATAAGAVHIGGNTLFLRGAVRDIFFEWLEEHRPDLLERYRKLYARGAYVPADERRTIEVAAGAPWAGRRYADRFRHRSSATPPNGDFGTLTITPPEPEERPTRSRGTLRLTQAVARGPAGGRRTPAKPEAPASPPPKQGVLF